MATLDVERYKVVVTSGRAGFEAVTPDLPGVRAHAATMDECVQLLRTTIAVECELGRMRGEVFPPPSGPGVVLPPSAAA
jgi:predicted RNase H-like HicB family nuclease